MAQLWTQTVIID